MKPPRWLLRALLLPQPDPRHLDEPRREAAAAGERLAVVEARRAEAERVAELKAARLRRNHITELVDEALRLAHGGDVGK